ncbi:TetR/AcrR family transcriptional regulator [Planomonospora venezuelensis]|uniref:TetR/AcrR family transcriptional regulator n=1 Tax=Planomonospora venezuelensis TaxID=1999 RepID=UPI001611769F|nr:TetR family transcriptional regulator [Planomonospora venezuelensis]
MEAVGSSVRRSPVQQRSVERVNQMLDAAAALLDEGGYDALSTRAVAVRAEVPIGSIYHFFRDKRGLADALARRNLESFLAGIDRRLDGATHWQAIVDLVVDEYVEMKRTVPGFAVVDFHGNRVVAESLAAHLAQRIAPVDADALTRPLLVAVEAADALLKLAFRESPEGDPYYVTETKELLRAYLGRALPH